MGKDEVWNGPVVMGELRERLAKADKPLSAWGLLVEWQHFIEEGRFAKKRHRDEGQFLRKFEQKIRTHVGKEEREKVHALILASFAQRYMEEAKRKARA